MTDAMNAARPIGSCKNLRKLSCATIPVTIICGHLQCAAPIVIETPTRIRSTEEACRKVGFFVKRRYYT